MIFYTRNSRSRSESPDDTCPALTGVGILRQGFKEILFKKNPYFLYRKPIPTNLKKKQRTIYYLKTRKRMNEKPMHKIAHL